MSEAEFGSQVDQSDQHESSVVPIELLRLLDGAVDPPAVREPEVHPTTDIANGARFRRLAVAKLLWVAAWDTWMAYDGQRWIRDLGGLEAMRIARDLPRMILREASEQDELEARKLLSRWAVSSGRIERLKAAVMLGRSEPDLRCAPDDFDRDIWVIGTTSGKLDLRTGQLTPPLPRDRITRCIDIPYDSGAACPRWESFLVEVFNGDGELIAYIQRVLGYCLTGSVREQVFWVLWGTGANGKSVLAEVLRLILGDYYHRADPDLFVTNFHGSRGGGASPQIAGLKGSRLAIASETPPHGRMAETILKEMTGGDAITARHLYGHPFIFTPSHKLVLLTNYKPRVSQDSALWRRMRLIPFGQTFSADQQDRRLLDKLKSELAGILAWAVRGAMAWANDGLQEPSSVRQATRDYQVSEDVLGRFVEECCVIDFTAVTLYSDLYKTFAIWSHENGEPQYGTHRFSAELESRGFVAKKGGKGVRLRCGLKLRDMSGPTPFGSALVR